MSESESDNLSIEKQIENAIKVAIPDAEIDVAGKGGHFRIKVVSAEFEGKSLLNKQRLVLSAISELMSSSNAPVHAIDKLQTIVPEK